MSKIEKAKNKSSYYKQKPHKNSYKKYQLNVNLGGFLVTCNSREKDCIKESYNILNKYADILYPAAPVESESNEKCEDIEDELKNELSTLKSGDVNSKRFQVIDSGAKNILFIRTTLENPVELAKTIIEDIEKTKLQQTKFLLRLIPVETTCKAFLKDIEKAVEPLLTTYFSNEPKTFSIFFNHRNHNTVSRDEVIKLVADMVVKVKDGHKVDLKNAELTIVIELIRSFAFIGVVPNFFKYKKYNLLSLCELDGSSSNNTDEVGNKESV